MLRTVLRVAAATGLTAPLTMSLDAPAPAGGGGSNTAPDRIPSWIQGLLLSIGVLAFVLGAGFYLAEGTIGGQERGKALMVGAVIGVILGFLAKPSVNLAASFVR